MGRVQIWPYVDAGTRDWLNGQASATGVTAGNVIDALVGDAIHQGMTLQRQAPDVRLVKGGDQCRTETGTSGVP